MVTPIQVMPWHVPLHWLLLKVFRDEKVIDQLPAKVDAFTKALEPIKSLKHVKEVRQRGPHRRY